MPIFMSRPRTVEAYQFLGRDNEHRGVCWCSASGFPHVHHKDGTTANVGLDEYVVRAPDLVSWYVVPAHVFESTYYKTSSTLLGRHVQGTARNHRYHQIWNILCRVWINWPSEITPVRAWMPLLTPEQIIHRYRDVGRDRVLLRDTEIVEALAWAIAKKYLKSVPVSEIIAKPCLQTNMLEAIKSTQYSVLLVPRFIVHKRKSCTK